MIKEAYVSFEVAKLLKEKGFNEYCLKNYWSSDKELHDWKWELSYNRNSDGNNNTKDCSAPTQAMAMKWLREVHNICIDIVSIWNLKRWEYQVFIITPSTAAHPYVDNTLYMGYEEAIDAALKYVLENLT